MCWAVMKNVRMWGMGGEKTHRLGSRSQS